MVVEGVVVQIDSGRSSAVVLPSDMSDPIRISLISSLQQRGWNVRHLPSIAVLVAELSAPSLEESTSSDKTLLIAPWPEDKESVTSAKAAVKMAEPGQLAVAFECPQYPPRKTKETSHILAVVEIPEKNLDSNWVQSGVDSAGMRMPPRAVQRLGMRVKGCPEAIEKSLKAVRLYLGSKEATEEAIQEIVLMYPDEDGRAVLEDLLNLRSVPLCRRIADLPEDKLVPLFRAATSELLIVSQVAYMMDDSKFVDYRKAAEATGLDEQRIRTRYAPLAASLGFDRCNQVLARLEHADTLLQRSQHRKLDIALAIAVSICRI